MENIKILNQKKEELQKQLDEIIEKKEDILRNKYFAEYKNLIGKCYKYVNTYGDGSKTWFLYTKITNIKPKNIIIRDPENINCTFSGFSFETDSRQKFTCEQVKQGWVKHLGVEISKEEFDKAFDDAVKKLLMINS